jgi:hypothetical protein
VKRRNATSAELLGSRPGVHLQNQPELLGALVRGSRELLEHLVLARQLPDVVGVELGAEPRVEALRCGLLCRLRGGA